MKYRFLFVGRKGQDPLVQAAEEYLGRLRHYASVDVHRVKEQGASREAQDLVRLWGGRGLLVVLDERGRSASTTALWQLFQSWRQHHTELTFVVGGSYGLDSEITSRAHFRLSLSPMTLPHRLAQVVLLEQLYRVHTISAGLPYHHGNAAPA